MGNVSFYIGGITGVVIYYNIDYYERLKKFINILVFIMQ